MLKIRLRAFALGLGLAAALGAALACTRTPPGTFATPEEAMQALADLAGTGDKQKAEEIFTPSGVDLLSSGDPDDDREDALEGQGADPREGRLRGPDDGSKIALLGNDAWPFPIPLVPQRRTLALRHRSGSRRAAESPHRPQRAAGAREPARVRRCAARVLRAGPRRAAPRLRAQVHERRGPARRPLLAGGRGRAGEPDRAAARRRRRRDGARRPQGAEPFNGYFFRILEAQGKDAPGGARSYLDAARPDDRRLRGRRLAREVRQLGHHDVHRRPAGDRLPEGPRGGYRHGGRLPSRRTTPTPAGIRRRTEAARPGAAVARSSERSKPATDAMQARATRRATSEVADSEPRSGVRRWRLGRRLGRYVVRELAFPTLLSLGGLSLLAIAADLVTFSDLIINRGFGFREVAAIALFRSVAMVSRAIPFSVLLGVLVALGRLGADREILALETCGVSTRRLVAPVLLFAALFTVLGVWISTDASPWANRRLTVSLAESARRSPGTLLRAGVVSHGRRLAHPGAGGVESGRSAARRHDLGADDRRDRLCTQRRDHDARERREADPDQGRSRVAQRARWSELRPLRHHAAGDALRRKRSGPGRELALLRVALRPRGEDPHARRSSPTAARRRSSGTVASPCPRPRCCSGCSPCRFPCAGVASRDREAPCSGSWSR